MSLPDFISNVEQGENQPGWLTPATVADLSDSDFVTMPPEQRDRLFRAVEQFRQIASASPLTPDDCAEARRALDTVLEILRPYRTEESRKIREAVWRAWKDHKAEIPTFDYELRQSSVDTPIVWVWLILRDDLDIDARPTRELLSRLRTAIRMQFHEADIERWPNIGVRPESEAKELATRGPA